MRVEPKQPVMIVRQPVPKLKQINLQKKPVKKIERVSIPEELPEEEKPNKPLPQPRKEDLNITCVNPIEKMLKKAPTEDNTPNISESLYRRYLARTTRLGIDP